MLVLLCFDIPPDDHVAGAPHQAPLLLQRHEVAEPDGRQRDEAVVQGLQEHHDVFQLLCNDIRDFL